MVVVVENGRLSYVAFVSFCEIQSNHALPRGGGICGNAPHLIGDVIDVPTFRSTAERQLTGHWF